MLISIFSHVSHEALHKAYSSTSQNGESELWLQIFQFKCDYSTAIDSIEECFVVEISAFDAWHMMAKWKECLKRFLVGKTKD